MPDRQSRRTGRDEPHLLTEGLRGMLVLVLTTAGLSAVFWLVAVSFAAMFR
jgi:hypothetical protein